MAKIFGQLERAQLEVLGADPSGAGLVQGRVWFNSSTARPKYYDGSGVKSLKPDDILNETTYAGSVFNGKWVGTTTNDNAGTGQVGEYFSALQSSPSNCSASTIWGNGASVALTAGDWDVSGVGQFLLNGSVTTIVQTAISIYSGNTTTDHIDGDNVASGMPPTATARSTYIIPTYRVSLSGNTTVYLKVNATYSSGTPQFVARISARRVR